MNNKLIAILAIGMSIIAVGVLMNQGSTQKKETSIEEIARMVNSDPTSTWTATANPQVNFDLKNLGSMFNLVIDEIPDSFDDQPELMTQESDLPETFDPREKWANCESLKEIRDQSACGSCWAFGAASAMTDRVCIQSNQSNQKRISTEDILSCCGTCGMGCNGGFLYQTWAYWKRAGVSTGGVFKDNRWCKPYGFPPCNHHSDGPYEDCSKNHYKTPKCVNKCTNDEYKTPYSQDKIYADKIYTVKGETEVMKELFEKGPIEAAFTVFEDFLAYKSGVYQHLKGPALGGHAVKLFGWGVENGVKYWLVVNSWNNNWGDKGTFKILRGKNHCGIEGSLVTGTAKL